MVLFLGTIKREFSFLQKALELSSEIEVSKDLRPRILDGMAEIYQNNGQLEEAYEASLECLRLSELFSQKVTKGMPFSRWSCFHETKPAE